jgi:hypothetical protein
VFHPQNRRPGQLAGHIALGIAWGGLLWVRLYVLTPSARRRVLDGMCTCSCASIGVVWQLMWSLRGIISSGIGAYKHTYVQLQVVVQVSS